MKGKKLSDLLLGGMGFLATVIGIVDGVKEVMEGHFDPALLFVVAAFLIIAIVVILRWGGLHLLRTGIVDSSFEFSEDETAWDEAKHSLIYVGVSGYSIAIRFLRWCEKHHDHLPKSIVFYLLNPDDHESLRVIASHRCGRPATEMEIAELAGQVRVGAASLRKHPEVTVRFYKVTASFIPMWMYLIDGEKLYLGFPSPGGTGMNSPAYLCSKRKDRYSIFDAYGELLRHLDESNGWHRNAP